MTEDFYCDEVLSGRVPVQVVAETDQVLAYHHTRPFWPVHVVVIPKRHVPSLIDLGGEDETILHQLLSIVRQVAKRITDEHGGCRVLTNIGEYQDSKHLHFHVNSGEPLPEPGPFVTTAAEPLNRIRSRGSRIHSRSLLVTSLRSPRM